MRTIGIDYGKKRVGVAISDEIGDFAYPYGVLVNTKRLVKEILEICKKEGVGEIVIGESLDFKGNKNQIMGDVEKFKAELEKETELPVKYENEFMTSAEASRGQGFVDKLDASAAAIILRTYLNRKNLSAGNIG